MSAAENLGRFRVANPGVIDYGYDAADQLTSRTIGTDTETFNYNADGLRLGGRVWDPHGRLTSYTANNKTTSYKYDGLDNRRLVTFDNGGTKSLSWDINHPMPMLGVETRSDGSKWSHRYTPDGWALSVKHTGQAFTRSFFHHDGMGSVVDVTTGSGGPAWQYAYDPWGVTTTATQQSTSPVDTKLGYTSAYFESTLGAYHLRARDYDPTIGRFVAPDPLTPPIEDPYVASYVYANNQPTVLTDPRGLAPCRDCGVGAIGGLLLRTFNRYFVPNFSRVFARSKAVARAHIRPVHPNAVTGCSYEARFAQTSYSQRFQQGGYFEGLTIDDVAALLRAGTLSPQHVPINIIYRGGSTLIVNTRSAAALTRAGLGRSQWSVINRTGSRRWEDRLDLQLKNNKLGDAGFPNPRPTG